MEAKGVLQQKGPHMIKEPQLFFIFYAFVFVLFQFKVCEYDF